MAVEFETETEGGSDDDIAIETSGAAEDTETSGAGAFETGGFETASFETTLVELEVSAADDDIEIDGIDSIGPRDRVAYGGTLVDDMADVVIQVEILVLSYL